jgi:hypothetical protein
MPTANTTSPKTRAKAARKAPARKATKPAAKATARRTSATKAKATQAKAARTRAVHSAESTLRQSQTASRETAGVLGDYAERAVLIPVGAALIARDRVVSSVTDTLSAYSTGTKAQAQLNRFERRGATARKRLEREVRKARVRVERDLRQRRRVIENTFNETVSEIEGRREAIAKNSSDLANRVPELANSVQERILSLV